MPSNQPVIVVGNNPHATNAASPSGVKGLSKRLFNVENLTQAILWVGIATVAGVLITSCAMVIDQFHFNNQTYKDQSSKNEAEVNEINARLDLLTQQIDELKKSQSNTN